jgi:glycosyltransferase involved in cell wall biosynthesis
MRIAIDARAFSWEGIGRYTRNLLRELARRNDDHEYVGLIAPTDRERARSLRDELDVKSQQRLSWHEVNGSYYSWREQVWLRRELARVKADLFHFTHFNMPAGFKRPYVVTIHDVTRFYFPGQNRQKLWQQLAYEWVFKQAVKNAKGVIVVSQSTRDELCRLPVEIPKLLEVIHEGVDPMFNEDVDGDARRKVRMLLGGQFPYVLFVGVWMGHKNLVRLVKAFGLVRKRFPGVKLVITGRPKPGYGSVFEAVGKYASTEAVVLPGFVDAKLLPALYAEAACFAFPSLYEGFGLPVLEAAAVGTPVVTSNVTSMPELLGEDVNYVNPESVEDIARGIIEVLQEKTEVVRKAKRARIKSGGYTWTETAARHVKVYESEMIKIYQ